MGAGLTLVTAPVAEPISVEVAKAWLRVDIDADDDLIADMISSARQLIEDRAAYAFMTQTWDQTMDGFPYVNEPIELLRGPVQSITSVKYTGGDGAQVTWPSTNYVFNGATKPPRIAPAFGTWWPFLPMMPLANLVIRFVAGSPAGQSWHAIQGIKLLCGHWYENREAVDLERVQALIVPEGVEEIIAQLKPFAVA